MFTGIIEEVGRIERIESMGRGVRLRVGSRLLAPELSVNDSVAINGACHTVVARTNQAFDVESVEETLKKTTTGSLSVDDIVNLELPVRLNGRLGGHLVLGHIDTVGEIIGIEKRSTSWLYSVRFGKQFIKYVIPVGSVAIDGVSLTVAETGKDLLRLSIIPHTMENTIFPAYVTGRRVNIEFDVVGKYIERMVSAAGISDPAASFPDEDSLRKIGF